MAFSIGLNCLAAVQIARRVGALQREGGKALMSHFAPLIDQGGAFQQVFYFFFCFSEKKWGRDRLQR